MRIGSVDWLMLLAISGSAAAAAQPGMPSQRLGLWQTTMASPGMPAGMTTRACIDPATPGGAAAFSGPFGGGPPGVRGAPSCSRRDFHSVPGGWAIHTVCTTPRGVVETNGMLRGDFQSHFSVALDVRAAGQAHHMTLDSRWLGPCKPGTPSSIVLPDGHVVTMPARPPR